MEAYERELAMHEGEETSIQNGKVQVVQAFCDPVVSWNAKYCRGTIYAPMEMPERVRHGGWLNRMFLCVGIVEDVHLWVY